MPLASRTGGPVVPPINPPISNDQTVPTTMQSVLDHQPYIEDTFVNRTAFNPQTYADEFRLLQRYISGSRVQVTYFNLSTPTAGLQRSESIDPSMIRNPIQTSYTQINNFEIVFQGHGLQSSFSQDSSETLIAGEALLYPGMQPRMGDLFVMQIGDSKFGILQVSSVERLTYRQGASHKINFFVREYGTEAAVAIIQQSVTAEVWFDKETYLGDATTLLREDSYIFLQTFRQMRRLLIGYYYNTFYDKTVDSILSPEGVYDPYLVQYLNAKISITDSIVRPRQLFPGLQNYDNSLWSRLTDVTNRRLINIQSSYNLIKYRVSRWDVSITGLVNRVMIGLDNPNRLLINQITPYPIPDTPPGITPSSSTLPGMGTGTFRELEYIQTLPGYIFTTNFYTGDKTLMTPFEFLIYAVIYDRKISDLRGFIEGFLNQYSLLTLDEQYYSIPLYLWLIDLGIVQISGPHAYLTT